MKEIQLTKTLAKDLCHALDDDIVYLRDHGNLVHLHIAQSWRQFLIRELNNDDDCVQACAVDEEVRYLTYLVKHNVDWGLQVSLTELLRALS